MELFTKISNLFADTLVPMQGAAHEAGLSLFGALGLLTIVWTGFKIMLGQQTDGVTAMARRLFGLALLFSIVVLSPSISILVINTAQEAASHLQTSVGLEPILFHSPSTVLTTYSEAFNEANEKIGEMGSWTIIKASLPFLFAISVLWISQLIFMLTVLRYALEAYVLIVLIPLFAGFAGAKATVGVAETAFNYLAGFGVRLLVLLLIVGLAPAIAIQISIEIAEHSLDSWSDALAIVGTALAYAILAMGMPALIGRGMAQLRVPLGDLLR